VPDYPERNASGEALDGENDGSLKTLNRTDVRFKLVLLTFFGLLYVLAILSEKSRQFPSSSLFLAGFILISLIAI